MKNKGGLYRRPRGGRGHAERLARFCDGAAAADGEGRSGVALNFVVDEPLETVERRLRAAGFPPEGTIVDQEWGRSLLCRRRMARSSRSMSRTVSSTREQEGHPMASVSVRYIVHDVDAA